MQDKLDILAFAAHPDDVEISASGIMLKHKSLGLKTGIVDISAGELGTRGNIELRAKESAKASEILKLDARVNLGLPDGFFEVNEASLKLVVAELRHFKPDIVLINSENDRHPDHGRAHELLKRACFLSGLPKIETQRNGVTQTAWRPKAIYAYIQDYYLEPDFIIDVTDHWKDRMDALMAYSSQFYNPESKEPQTPISTPDFLRFIEGRAAMLGRLIGAGFGEGLRTIRPAGVNSLTDLI